MDDETMELGLRVLAERRIQEAIDEGKFENLPGKGKPLQLDEDPLVPVHLRLAMRVLKNANVLPTELEIDREIDQARQECERLWQRIEREYPRRQSDPAWRQQSRDAYRAALSRVNTCVLKRNVSGLSSGRLHRPYRIDDELARFDASFPPAAE